MAEFASRGVANAGLATGIVGTALGVLNGGTNILGMNGGFRQNGDCMGIMNLMMAVAAKDSEIAMLKSEQNTEIKIADVYERLATKINANQREQDAINREQAVYNGVNTATVGYLHNQIDQLMALTRRVIPNTSICPGWGEVTIEPVPPTA